ncbi:MAG: hypothetical protein AB7G75_16850 [Candidatus Binatia bacterium]
MKTQRHNTYEPRQALPRFSPGSTEPHTLLHTEAVLPEQFFAEAKETHTVWTGERLLMLAVLQEALHSYDKYQGVQTKKGQRLFAEVREWFWSSERHYLYSFETICDHLLLAPDYIRRRLQQDRAPQQRATQSSCVVYRKATRRVNQGGLAVAA